MVVNLLGAEQNAYFFIAWAISGLLLVIPIATSTSLLAEGSYGEDLRFNVIRAVKFIFLLLLPAVAFIFFFGNYLLLIFGKQYAENSFEVLRVLAVASIPYSLNCVYAYVKRVRKEIKPVIYVYGSLILLTLIGSYLSAQNMRIIGVGIAWVVGNVLVCSFIVPTFLHKAYSR